MSSSIKPTITFNHGIEQVFSNAASQEAMPDAKNVSPHLAASFKSLEDMFHHDDMGKEVEAFLTPAVSDPALLLPENFVRELSGALTTVASDIRTEEQRSMVEELNEAVENQQLFSMLKNLVVAG